MDCIQYTKIRYIATSCRNVLQEQATGRIATSGRDSAGARTAHTFSAPLQARVERASLAAGMRSAQGTQRPQQTRGVAREARRLRKSSAEARLVIKNMHDDTSWTRSHDKDTCART